MNVSDSVLQGGTPSFDGATSFDQAAVRQESQALSVSAAVNAAKQALEGVTVRILGEVSEVSVKPGYKAAYFTIKDTGASLSCLMWNNRYRSSGVQLAVGQLVEVSGKFTLYAAKGRMNFDVSTLSLAGEGNLRLKVANIARKLQAEGLTDQSRKRRLPVMPERIGLVTSPRSAAVHDVLRTLRRRFPVARIFLAGVTVEGAQAPSELIAGIDAVVNAGAEVVLVVRGGGSFEDLMPFNDEQLARHIAACPIPVVTGIGHEVDTSIADMVSDFRASTPTAAAEAVSPALEQLEQYLGARHAALCSGLKSTVDQRRAIVERLSSRPVFQDATVLTSSASQFLDMQSDRLSRALPAYMGKEALALSAWRERLASMGPRLLDRQRNLFAQGAGRLNDLSPLGTLARGYSVARLQSGGIVRSVSDASVGDCVRIELADGGLSCLVEAKDNVNLLGIETGD